jgi:hypothetical protein
MTELLGKLGTLVHVLHRAGRDIQIVALELAGGGLGPVDGFHAVEKAVAPVHERLRVDVFIILGEIQAALQALVHHAAVVLARQPQLGFDGRTQQGTAEFVESLALHDDAGGRALEGFYIGGGKAHVFQAQRPQRLETKHVANDRGGDVGNRSGLEQVQVVGDVGKELIGGARHRLDLVRLGAIALTRSQPVRPHNSPRCR